MTQGGDDGDESDKKIVMMWWLEGHVSYNHSYPHPSIIISSPFHDDIVDIVAPSHLQDEFFQ